MNDYRHCGWSQNQPAIIKKADAEKMEKQCTSWAVIPSYTVEHEVNTDGVRSAFVHVTETNTTYYIDNQHRKIITWMGDLFIDDYDPATNPLNLRRRAVYDFANNRQLVFDNAGTYRAIALDNIMPAAEAAGE